jgi:hypothetical protein
MIASVVRIMLSGMIFGLLVGHAHADDPPILNMSPSCEGAARTGISLGRNKQACMDEEGKAQDLLTRNWSQYRPADKTQCVGMASKGGPPSYVELLSCIEIMRDAAAIHKAEPEDDTDTTGSIGRRRPQVSSAPRAAYLDDGIRAPKPVPSKPSRLADLGADIFPRERQTPEALGAMVKADAEKWWPIIKELGIKAE